MDVTTIVTACHQRAKAQELSLAQVANQIGVDRSLVGHWFNARRTPSAPNLLALMDTVGLQIQLIGEPSPNEADTRVVQAKQKTATSSANKPKAKGHSEREKMFKLPPRIKRAARVIGISFDDLTQESVTTAVKTARESLKEGSELANLEEKAAELTQWLQSR